ncbi:hypothetical protein GGI21_005133, partial [Coemansia aciculifera]
ASVPGSQPLATATRALVALYAVRVEPIDAYERVSEARNYAFPACRVTVACCMDLAGNVPLALRRAASSRVPELYIARIAMACRQPMPPYIAAPSGFPRLMPNADRRREHVQAEAVEEMVDGLPVVFLRTLEGGGGCVVSRESNDQDEYVAVASVTGAVLRQAHVARQRCLRNGGQSSGPEDLPLVVPVICDIIVDSQACFAVSIGSSDDDETLLTAADSAASSIPCGVWRSGRLAVYVFALAEGSRHLVRTALLANEDTTAIGWNDADYDDNDIVATCTVSIQSPSADAVTVNGQRMQVHQALPPRQSLLFVVGASGCVLDACRECGNIACAADALPGAQPLVAYASDESSDEEEAKEDHCTGPQLLRSSRNSSSNIAALARPAQSPPQSPPPLPPSMPSQSILRQRTGLGVVKSEATKKEDKEEEQQQRTTADSTAGRASLAVRAALAVLSLAVFLPVRRMAVGGTTVEQWLLARTDAG